MHIGPHQGPGAHDCQFQLPVTVHFLEDLERILTSDPASPPLAPLSTSEPCLACEAWATW